MTSSEPNPQDEPRPRHLPGDHLFRPGPPRSPFTPDGTMDSDTDDLIAAAAESGVTTTPTSGEAREVQDLLAAQEPDQDWQESARSSATLGPDPLATEARHRITPGAPDLQDQPRPGRAVPLGDPTAVTSSPRHRGRGRRAASVGHDHHHHWLSDLRMQARRAISEPEHDPHDSETSILSSKQIDLAHARAVVDLAGRIASAALASGATAAEATALLLRVTHHFKVSVHADVTLTSVTITHFRSLEMDPITVLRTVRSKVTDYRRLEAVEDLVNQITQGTMALTAARQRIAEIILMPRTFRRWVQVAARAMLGLWVTALFGGDLTECLLAFITCAGVDLAQAGVFRIKAPEFFAQVAGAAVCGVIALAVMWARAQPQWTIDSSPSLIVAAGMVSMLAGLSMTTAARDAIDGYFLTAAARLVEVASLTGGIVLGLTLTLYAGLKLGVPAYLSPTTGAKPLWWVQIIAAALIAVAFAINNHLRPRNWVLAGCFGVLTWAISSGVGSQVAATPGSAGLAAFVAGLIGQSLNRLVHVPTTALVTAGVVSLVPGMSLYRGLLGLVQTSQGQVVTGNPSSDLFGAVMVAVMLAAGVSLGVIAGRPLSMPSDWSTRLALAKAWGRGRAD